MKENKKCLQKCHDIKYNIEHNYKNNTPTYNQ